jgi:glycosyltransferase involved in cell wall biosynthesis
MLKVVSVVDKVGTALDRLAKGVAPYHDNLDYIVCDVHPKRPDPEQLARFEAEAMDADIIDWQYFRTAELLRSKYDWLKDKKHILTHNNPYSITESDWNTYDINVGNNEEITANLRKITNTQVEYIPITVDSDFWTFNTEWEPNNSVVMVANRIESKKGILPVAIAVADLGMKFILVGAVSDRNYVYDIMQTGNNIEFHEQITDEELKKLYYRSTVHVCNSVDNFESGTMPVLESMYCGVPVLTRKVGHVPDLYNGENMVIQSGSSEDVVGITEKLKEMVFDKKMLSEMREKAWNSVKSRNFERRAYEYQKLYRQVMYPDQAPVSVVVPIYDRPEIISKCLTAVANQTYKNVELVVADDAGNNHGKGGECNKCLVENFAKFVNIPVRYINTADGGYGLARARNEATIQATGEIIVYCDERMVMNENAVDEFVKNIKPKTWLYGKKQTKKEFVENFSCVYRKEVIEAGLFNERINQYGGQSQEVRSRIRAQGFQIEYVETAECTPTGKSSNRNRKRNEIIKMKNKLWKMGL